MLYREAPQKMIHISESFFLDTQKHTSPNNAFNSSLSRHICSHITECQTQSTFCYQHTQNEVISKLAHFSVQRIGGKVGIHCFQ